MSEENTKRTTSKPTHAIYQVFGNDDKARWQRIGSGWMNKDRQGLNLTFDSLPINGRIVAREIKVEEGGAK